MKIKHKKGIPSYINTIEELFEGKFKETPHIIHQTTNNQTDSSTTEGTHDSRNDTIRSYIPSYHPRYPLLISHELSHSFMHQHQHIIYISLFTQGLDEYFATTSKSNERQATSTSEELAQQMYQANTNLTKALTNYYLGKALNEGMATYTSIKVCEQLQINTKEIEEEKTYLEHSKHTQGNTLLNQLRKTIAYVIEDETNTSEKLFDESTKTKLTNVTRALGYKTILELCEKKSPKEVCEYIKKSEDNYLSFFEKKYVKK